LFRLRTEDLRILITSYKRYKLYSRQLLSISRPVKHYYMLPRPG